VIDVTQWTHFLKSRSKATGRPSDGRPPRLPGVCFVVMPRTRKRLAIAFLAVLAILFAPRDPEPIGDPRHAGKPLEPRIIASAFYEAVVAVGPKLTNLQFHAITQRSRLEAVSLAVTLSALLILLAAFFARGLPTGNGHRLIARHASIPRGPPSVSSPY
jgi:hypothetical protein